MSSKTRHVHAVIAVLLVGAACASGAASAQVGAGAAATAAAASTSTPKPAPTTTPIPTPAQQFARVTSNLDRLPAGWIESKPLRLEVAFNLKYPPGSAEANAFLAQWRSSIGAMPYHVQLETHRIVSPAKFLYLVCLTFDDWKTYRSYESSAEFLKYYHEYWKPAVTELDERLTIVEQR
jgi:hypothetical protein